MEAIMAQALSLGAMLKAKLAEKQQPVQLELDFNGTQSNLDAYSDFCNYATSMDLHTLFKLKDSGPRSYALISEIRYADRVCKGRQRIAAKQLARDLDIIYRKYW
jgi:hypothetical protein